MASIAVFDLLRRPGIPPPPAGLNPEPYQVDIFKQSRAAMARAVRAEVKNGRRTPAGNAGDSAGDSMKVLDRIESPRDLKALSPEDLAALGQECRDVIVETITRTGGHLASNLGVVELTLALHRSFDSPKDRIVWDTSNQCYTH